MVMADKAMSGGKWHRQALETGWFGMDGGELEQIATQGRSFGMGAVAFEKIGPGLNQGVQKRVFLQRR